ncbi:Dynamin-1-like protein [Folsomia candida]|uniref:Dynamin-1-like protein n=1 Tax=Folsomia candida TaxID=158441 RepID=A0A226D3T2_FOLCA|nr:Dynamin-1-like protein [Folsomia candida]
MDRLIPVINKLQAVFDKTGTSVASAIQLPKIAVLGSQSSGKSSVLEGLVGKPFLPRGKDIVTRCPIVLMLNNRPGKEEYCEFEHKKGTKFKIEQVEAEILRRTDELTGGGKGVVHDPILLSVYSPNVLTLTVVDLPGLVKNVTDGQPDDIVERVEELVFDYISQPDTLILAVSAGDVEIANSESINFAKRVDPEQERTLGVVTKLDKADDLEDVLAGKKIPLKLGFVGVMNRSQQDLDNGVTADEILALERQLLQAKYTQIADRHGMPFLASRLNQILLSRIKKCFPALDAKIKDLFRKREQDLADLGEEATDKMSTKDKLKCLTTILNKFEKVYKAQFDGQGRTDIDPSELTAGANIDFIFQHTLAKDLSLLNPLIGISDEEIMIAVRNAGGIALQHLIKREVAKMKPVALHCVDMVHTEMRKTIAKCLPYEQRFLTVNDAIETVVIDLLTANERVTRDIMETYIDIQASCAKTFDQTYRAELAEKMGTVNTVGLGDMPLSHILTDNNGAALLTLSGSQAFSLDPNSTFTQQQTTLCQIVRDLIETFFNIVDELIREADAISEQRTYIKLELEGLTEATKILDEYRGTSAI